VPHLRTRLPMSLRVKTRIPPERSHVSFPRLRTGPRKRDLLVSYKKPLGPDRLQAGRCATAANLGRCDTAGATATGTSASGLIPRGKE
jgi:hypothetical protein